MHIQHIGGAFKPAASPFIRSSVIHRFLPFLTTARSIANMSPKATNEQAQAFKALHIPGKPVLLPNIYDVTSTRIVGALPACKVLATASFAIALAQGTEDSKLDLKTHLSALKDIAEVAHELGKPLTVDLQDGYGAQLEEAVRAVIDLGVVGINLEDSEHTTHAMVDDATAVDRIKRILAVAADAGVPEFVVNARSDTHFMGGSLDESIRRGKLYLEAGATTVYILGTAPTGFTREEVKKMVDALDGKVNISQRLPKEGMTSTPLTSQQLGELGIARISVGPQLYYAVAEALKNSAALVLGNSANS